MPGEIMYMIDEKGLKTSAIIPIKKWEKMNGDYKKLQTKLKFLTGLKNALQEVKESKTSGNKLQTLTDFLDECNR